MSYWSQKWLRWFSGPNEEEIFDRLARIEVALNELGKFPRQQQQAQQDLPSFPTHEYEPTMTGLSMCKWCGHVRGTQDHACNFISQELR